MVAQAVRRRGLSRLLGQALVLALVLAVAPVRADTTFLTGEELAERLRRNLVWIAAEDVDEHGFGLVVGADAQRLWIVTARHVVVRLGMRGSGEPERPSTRILLRLCSGGADLMAEPWSAWVAGDADLALLTAPRPAGFEPETRALAAQLAPVGEPAWLLGSNDECALVPARGLVRAGAEAGPDLRIDFAGVRGGSSGGPVLSGRGVIGLMKSAEDLTTTVHDIADVQRRVQATAGAVWQLASAQNLPPGDREATRVDLAETLNQYLLALNNAWMLLQQPTVARATMDDFVGRYNVALRRFLRVRESHDGALARHWPAPVLPAWRTLREGLWVVHQHFWRLDAQMREIYTNQATTPVVRADMAALAPDLQRLEADIRQFLQLLDKEP
ncbi:serine protease [Pelomonas cellulosilytica]|uniref:Serine protease n=1 Tax=Pelomonas cellulosilytica TaxID=2906762 RepID=A0ABS8XT53_9BURK|nr:serine protease [Pelomonas sp. P8]MCE4553844.1 serine protease [Pelomonas sp. P8]